MDSQVNEISSVLVEVTVEVPWDRVEKDLDESFKQLSRHAKVKGFRPGKVPPKVVRRIYGGRVRGEVAANLVEEGIFSAIQQHEIAMVAQPQVEDISGIEDGKPLKFKAKIEVRPTIDKVKLDGLAVSRRVQEITNEIIDEEVEEMRRQHAELRTPDPMRPAKDGDQVTIDYEVALDGEAKPEMGAKDRPVLIGSGQVHPEFEKGLVGASPGDEKTIEVTFDDEHAREEIQGKTAVFTVAVKELQETILPELDDEFAKDLGDFETLLELRLKIREQMEEMADKRAESELKEKLIDGLIDANPIEVPHSMVQQEEHQMMYELASWMGMTGQQQPMTEELHASMHGRAERKVKAAILLGALARQAEIGADETDFDKKLEEIAEQTGKHIAKVKAEYSGEKRSLIENQILEEKLIGYLKSAAKVSEEKFNPADEAGAGEASTAKDTDEKKASASGAGATEKGEAKKKAAPKKTPAKKTASKKAPAKKKTAAKKAAAPKKKAAAKNPSE